MNKVHAYTSQVQPNELVERYGPLVQRIAHHLLARLPASVLVEDLTQAGLIGLLEASKNFDASKGASFETFAGIRIRGAMLDEMRRGDWVPRSVHKNSRMIAQAIDQVEKELGVDAKDADIAAKLGVSLDEYHTMLREVNSGKLIGIEDLGAGQESVGSDEMLDNSPLDGVFEEKFQHHLATCIKSLPEREALVLSLYYDEELNLREIGEVLDVSESRVSQIHSQAIHRLKGRMTDWQR
ncbi:RNA polymerase sigma factor FliA [Motilimonas eburnea]|uniref:RNA polymerase sigma factor FliA n=1 Tax=Motilimonas eburnea TaxID=1737488 RepID=UPI001E4413ED|nr:RNA polymerase sigma factor FliA [Motilimonas eburnea]